MNRLVIPLLKEKLTKLDIPEISGKTKVIKIAKLKYKFKEWVTILEQAIFVSHNDVGSTEAYIINYYHCVFSIKLTEVEIGSSSLETDPKTGLRLRVTDISLKVEGRWSYKTWYVCDNETEHAAWPDVNACNMHSEG